MQKYHGKKSNLDVDNLSADFYYDNRDIDSSPNVQSLELSLGMKNLAPRSNGLSANFSQFQRKNYTELLNFSTDDYEELVLWKEFEHFRVTWNIVTGLCGPVESIVLAFGLLGNLLALATLIRSKNLRAPTFLYHRIMVSADTLFCANYFLNVLIDKTGSVGSDQSQQFIFGTWIAAFYSGIIYSVIQITSTYLIQYMSLIIVFERFLAFHWCSVYERLNRVWVSHVIGAAAFIASAMFHSWAPWFQRRVIEQPYNHSESNQSTIAYTWVKREELFGNNLIW